MWQAQDSELEAQQPALEGAQNQVLSTAPASVPLPGWPAQGGTYGLHGKQKSILVGYPILTSMSI